MKSWSELTEKEKEALIKLMEEFAKIIDAYLDELVPAIEYFLGIMIEHSATIRALAEIKDNGNMEGKREKNE